MGVPTSAGMVVAAGAARKGVAALDILLVHPSREDVAGLVGFAQLISMSVQLETSVAAVPIVLLLPLFPTAVREIPTELHVPTRLAHTFATAGRPIGKDLDRRVVEMTVLMSMSVKVES